MAVYLAAWKVAVMDDAMDVWKADLKADVMVGLKGAAWVVEMAAQLVSQRVVRMVYW